MARAGGPSSTEGKKEEIGSKLPSRDLLFGSL
jgi:hypothetical protein